MHTISGADGVRVPLRAGARRVEAKGIYQGAEVVRTDCDHGVYRVRRRSSHKIHVCVCVVTCTGGDGDKGLVTSVKYDFDDKVSFK